MQRRRTATTAGVALVLGLTLAACGQSNTPSAYEPIVEGNFLEACTNRDYTLTDDTLAITDATLAPDVTGGSDEQCRCQYQVFVDMVPYNSDDTSQPGYEGPTFTELDDALRNDDDPAAAFDRLPEDVRDALSSCPLPDRPTGSGSDTTTADETTTTTEG